MPSPYYPNPSLHFKIWHSLYLILTFHFQPVSWFGPQSNSILPSLYPTPYYLAHSHLLLIFSLHSFSISSLLTPFEFHLLTFIFNCTLTYYPSPFQISFKFLLYTHVHISLFIHFHLPFTCMFTFSFHLILAYFSIHNYLAKTPSRTTFAQFEFLFGIHFDISLFPASFHLDIIF